MKKKTGKTETFDPNEPHFGHFCMNLTILDQAYHNADYYSHLREDGDEFLLDIRRIQISMIKSLNPEQIAIMVSRNPHLEHLLTYEFPPVEEVQEAV